MTLDTLRMIETPEALEDLVAELEAEPAYAIDTEFAREHTYFPDLALIQIAWSRGLAIVDPLRVPIEPLARVFRGPGLAVLHAASADLEIFAHRLDTVPARMFDTQLAGAFLGHGLTSLAQLVRAELGVELAKGEQLNDWKRRPLSDAAIVYAASDVAHLLALHRAMADHLESRGRTGWVAEETERARTRDQGPRDPDTAWWKLKGRTNLSSRAQGVAQAVGALREREAARRNVVTKFILADLAVLAIAQRPPRTLAELGQIRGIDTRQLGGGMAEKVLEAVAYGLEMPRDARRVATRPETEAPASVAMLCVAWVAARAAEEKIDPAMLATRDDVNALLIDPSRSRLSSGFRRALVGDELLRIVCGEARLAVVEGERLALVPV